jgi:hypothetical protein
MKNLFKYTFYALLATSIFMISCSEEEAEPEEVSDLIGTWKLSPTEGSMRVGPADGDYSWWYIGQYDADFATTRGCTYDDTYEFTEDGDFVISMGGNTWLEAWQGMDPEGCGTPVAPHVDGTFTFTHDEDAGTLTLNGSGAFMGLPKATNSGERSTGAAEPSSRTYVVQSLSSTSMELRMNTGQNSNGDEVHWSFTFTKQ